MDEPQAQDVTAFLLAWSSNGDREALAEVFRLVGADLRRMAQGLMKGEASNHTLEPTALVHEFFIRLGKRKTSSWEERGKFFAYAVKTMREALIDHGRARRAGKRGGGVRTLSFEEVDDVLGPTLPPSVELISLGHAMRKLARIESRQATIIGLRFLAGFSVEEVATALEVSPATVKRDTTVARAWLYRELKESEP